MNKYEELVKECHKAMELSIDDAYSVNLLTLRQKLINEETDELNVEINTLIDELKITGTILKETKLKMFK